MTGFMVVAPSLRIRILLLASRDLAIAALPWLLNL
jgi:hypothetical protein